MLGPRHLLVVSVLALAAAACSSDDASTTASTTDDTTASPSEESGDEPDAAAGSTTEPESAPTTAPSTTAAPAASATPTTAAPTTSPATTTPATTLPPPPPAEVVVTSAGAEPRSALRLALTPGTTTITMVQTQEVVQTLDGFEAPSSGPITLVMTLDVEVTELADGYQLASVTTAARPGDDVDPVIADALAAELDALIGLAQTSVVDRRGRPVGDTTVSIPDSVPEEVASLIEGFQFEQAFAPLPEEPVGVGATWTVETHLDQLGVDLTQTVEYQLVEVDGTRIHLVSTGTQRAEPGPVQLPGVPAIVSVTIESWEGTLVGDIWQGLTEPAPASTVSLEARQVFTFEDRTSSGELAQDISTTLTLSPD